jgi:bifunctional non-homologous end joining protein LigD
VTRLPKIELMQSTEVGQPFHRDGWVYEEKYDGWRMVAYKDGTDVKLLSRAGKEHSRRFAELAAAIRALRPMTLILNGEVAIFDDQLISRFEWFRNRPEDVASTPPIYMAFDCLYLEGRELRPLRLRERREHLERVVENDNTLIFSARRLGANGLEAWDHVKRQGYEGLVAKDESSAYRGGRTLSWLKVRQPDYRVEERGWDPARSKS